MKKEKAVGYIRTAVFDESGKNIHRQESVIKEYCDIHNLSLQHIFSDNGARGNDLKRKGWIEMMDYIEKNNGIVKRLVVSNGDRISRNFFVYKKAEDKLKSSYGVEIHSRNTGLDLQEFLADRKIKKHGKKLR